MTRELLIKAVTARKKPIELYRAAINEVLPVLEKAGFRVTKKMGDTHFLNFHNLGEQANITIYEQGGGWHSGAWNVGIIAGIYGKKADNAIVEDLCQDAFKRAEKALKRAGFKVKGTSKFSKIVDRDEWREPAFTGE